MEDAFAISVLALALVPAALFAVNSVVFRSPGDPGAGGASASGLGAGPRDQASPAREDDSLPLPAVAILIPARDEAHSIAGALEAAATTRGVEFEIVVLDDHSTDGTPDIVRGFSDRDPRIRLEHSRPLPEGWCGKQHACAQLAERARYDLLCFIDADVRLTPDGVARLAGFLRSSGAGLVSAVPRQITVTLLEKLLIPLIHFFMLGYLPIPAMRRSVSPSLAAGCGQLFLAERQAYVQAGGHAAIRASLHDGLTLPRAFRHAGLRTDICDGTSLATCRMYRNASEVWKGLLKNAHEGVGSAQLIGVFTVLLIGGCILPFLLPLLGAPGPLSIAAMSAAWFPRLVGVVRFRDSVLGALLHPLSILVFLAVQWTSFLLRLAGRKPAAWKGRAYY
ncbi:MAG TPA: glycosyltransferase [Longimicrobiaceae bacterium]|nr:glycosyltransferase [Longimicrobiaceae bacterium]